MTDGTRIEGLIPWVASGDVAEIIRIFANWLDATSDTEATLELKQWDIHGRYPDHDLRAKVQINIHYGNGEKTGSASIEVWRGADPSKLPGVLAEALAAARVGHELRKQNGSLYHVATKRFSMEPGEVTP